MGRARNFTGAVAAVRDMRSDRFDAVFGSGRGGAHEGALASPTISKYLPVGTRGLLELRVLDPVRAVGGTFTFAQQLRDVVDCVGNAGCALAAYEAADGAILLATDLELGQYGPVFFLCIKREVARRLGLPAGQVICKSICPAPKRVEVIRRFPPRATVS